MYLISLEILILCYEVNFHLIIITISICYRDKNKKDGYGLLRQSAYALNVKCPPPIKTEYV